MELPVVAALAERHRIRSKHARGNPDLQWYLDTQLQKRTECCATIRCSINRIRNYTLSQWNVYVTSPESRQSNQPTWVPTVNSLLADRIWKR